MTIEPPRRLIFSFRSFSKAASVITIFVASLVLVGWQFNLETFKRMLPGLTAMNPITAVSFTLAGLALWLLGQESVRPGVRRIAQALAGLAALVGLLKIISYLTGWDVPVDQLLFRDKLGADGALLPDRMAPNTALNFLLIGSALLILDGKGRRDWIAQFLVITAGFVALLAVIGYAYGARELYGFATYIPMALHTALLFFLFCFGFLCAYADRGPMATFASDSTGGILARRLLPTSLILPFILGWLRLEGERRGLYSTAFGTTLFTVASILTFAAIVWWTAHRLYQTDLARKQAQAALARERDLLYALMDNIPDTIYFKDTASRFTRINRAQTQVLGVNHPADAIGKTDADFQAPHLAEMFYAEEQALMRSGQPLVDRLEYNPTPEGRPRWFSATKVPLQDAEGRVVGLVGISRDVTERKEAQEATQKLNQELETRTVQLEAANKELEAFSYSVSHDLRAPLRAIDGFSQALLEDYADQLDVEGQDYLQRIRRAAQRMAKLIDDLLQLSRVTRSDMRREALDLSALAHSVADELRQREPHRQAEFVIAEGVGVEGDPRLLRVALENLLGNAWKFTGRQPHARIEFGLTQHDGVRAYFVRDNGVGFDMAYASKLFGAFQRLHGATEFPGTGIGLATVQRIIHRHGGRVWAEGKTGEGASFYFTLSEDR